MTEFVDVLKMARRMCKSIDDCGDCPLMDASTELCYLDKCPKEYNDKDFIRHEAAIMKWAAENPEIRYPTWRDHFRDAEITIRPCMYINFTDAHCRDYKGCTNCANQPIPAEIAEKLGIHLAPGAKKPRDLEE